MKKLKLEELQRIDVENFKKSEKTPLIVICDEIRSMMNVGSIFRTCDAFAVEELVLIGITPQPPHREIQKTALGATESVDWVHFETISLAIKHYKSLGYVIVGLEQTSLSQNIFEYEFNEKDKYVLVLGNEVDGISNEGINLLDVALEIPQSGTKHSLNVSVAAGIAIGKVYEKIGKSQSKMINNEK